MAGSSDPDAAAARQLRRQALKQIKDSLLHLLVLLRDNVIRRWQLLQRECALQRDCASLLGGNLHEEIELLGRLALPKELERLQGLMRGTVQLRATMEQRRAEIQRETEQLRAYMSALHEAASLMTGQAVMSGPCGITGAGPGGL